MLHIKLFEQFINGERSPVTVNDLYKMYANINNALDWQIDRNLGGMFAVKNIAGINVEFLIRYKDEDEDIFDTTLVIYPENDPNNLVFLVGDDNIKRFLTKDIKKFLSAKNPIEMDKILSKSGFQSS